MTSLAQLRDDVRSQLGIYLAESTIDDQAIDAALRHALRFGAQFAPIVDLQVELIADGRVQDISSLIPGIAKLLSVQYPYDPDYPTANRYPYDLIGQNTIRFGCGSPAIGEAMIVSGRPLYTLQDLNGTTDTMPTDLEEPFVMLAVAQVVRVEGLRRAMIPVAPTDKASRPTNLMIVAKEIEEHAIQLFYANQPIQPNPVWSSAWQ